MAACPEAKKLPDTESGHGVHLAECYLHWLAATLQGFRQGVSPSCWGLSLRPSPKRTGPLLLSYSSSLKLKQESSPHGFEFKGQL